MGNCKSLKKGKNRQFANHIFAIDIKKHYEFCEFLGSGHFGTVNRAVLIEDPSQEFAIKKISREMIHDSEDLQQEVHILCELHHPNIIKIYETYQDPYYLYIVMQYCSGGTLYSKISNHSVFTEKDAALIMHQIIRAVRYLHSKGICHRDIKPENFLYSSKGEKGKLKLIDFGLSQKQGKWFKSMNDVVGTPYYVAPEVLGGSYDKRCDVWSIGVIMYVILTGNLPFYAKNKDLLVHRIQHSEISYVDDVWNRVSAEAKDLITQLLCKDPELRITIEKAHKHPWFSKVFDDPAVLSSGETIIGYAYKEESLIEISNHLINNFSYHQLFALKEKIDKLPENSQKISEFEKELNTSFSITNTDVTINVKKVMRSVIWAKLHLNEEKIVKAFESVDYLRVRKISLSGLKKLIQSLEGTFSRDPSLFPKKLLFTLEDVLTLYDFGKGLQ